MSKHNPALIGTPHDRLMAAIGILQCHHLASQTELDGEAIYGIHHMPSASLEHAIQILIGVLGDVEEPKSREVQA